MVALIGFASQKPTGDVLIEVDWTHPLTRGLVDFLAFDDGSYFPRNYGSPQRATNMSNGTPRPGVGPGGARTTFNGSNQGLVGDYGLNEPVFSNAEYISLGIQFDGIGSNTSGTILSVNSGATFPYCRLATNSPNGVVRLHTTNGSQQQSLSSARSVYRDGKVHAMAVRASLNYTTPVANSTILYGDGILEGVMTPPSGGPVGLGGPNI